VKKPIPFGKYVLLERINVGGMAEVFKAKAFGVEGFERLVAVKRILPSIAEDQEFITMFIDEAKISVQLTHAQIAQIFDLGKVGDAYFIAMEFVHGKDLRAIFDRARKRGETVPVPMACYLAMKACEGLDYAHNKKDAAGRDLHLVHRDVSPQNVLLSYDGEVKIIDFGIAKAAGKAGRTQAGILKGKFGYMSPEQVRGLPLDRRSDIFAVGIVLYELLTGERLFVGESDFSTLEKVRNVEIMPPSTYNRRIPEELEQIVLKALAKDVDDRYQTAMDLHDDLQSFMYTSGNFFSRKDLSAYMRKAFADEIAKETAREEEYRRMEADGALGRPAASGPSSGLEAFADLEPLEASQPSGHGVAPPAQAFSPQRSSPAPSQPSSGHPLAATLQGGKAANVSAQPPGRGAAPKRTMLGMGAVQASVPPPPPRTSVPPPPPRASVEPPKPVTVPPPHAVVPPHTAAGPDARGGIDMEWDEEELSTQIYDKPDAMQAMLVADVPPTNEHPKSMRPSLAKSSAPPGVQGHPSSPGLQPASSRPPLPPPSHPPLSQPAPSYPSGPSATKSGSGAPSPFEAPRLEIGPEPTALTRNAERRSGGMMGVAVAAIVLLALGVGVGGFVLMRSSPGTITLTTIPNDPVVYLDGVAMQSSTASPFRLADVEPGPHLLVLQRDGFDDWATTVTVEPGSDLNLPPVTLMPRTMGSAPRVAAGPPTSPGGAPLPGVAPGTPTAPTAVASGAGGASAPSATAGGGAPSSVGPSATVAPPGPTTTVAAGASASGGATAAVVGAPPTGFTLTTIPPGARVMIDERELAQRTPVEVTDLAPGTYRVRVDHGPSYAPWLTQITLTPGQVMQLPPAVLSLRSVSVAFTSEPAGADVVLVRGSERRSIGATPTRADVDVTSGAWTVRMEERGYRTYEAALTLPAGEASASHAATLERAQVVAAVDRPTGDRPTSDRATSARITPRRETATTPIASASTETSGGGAGGGSAAPERERGSSGGGPGTLRINTRPWSQVFVDGRLVGNTPQMNIPLPAGRHTVTLVNSDFDIRHTITVEIQAGQTETRVLTLEPGS
jgi:serine/threonine protein kinase